MSHESPADGRAGITADLVRHLIAAQAPQWAGLPVRPVRVDGWDNRTYRLGRDLAVRLPTRAAYAPAVEKECRWLPVLAPHLPVTVPEPLFTGRPGEGYPFAWSVRRWLPGEPAAHDRVPDLVSFAREVGELVVALERVDATGGPAAGDPSFHRGASPAFYDDQTRARLAQLAGRVDVARAAAVWDDALDAGWSGAPEWFHGDLAVGNLLVEDGRLAAVIDFGTCGVGDPACDLVLAWTFLSGAGRREFRAAVDQDASTWARARGWALWKALISMNDDQPTSEAHLRVVDEVLADPVGS